MRSGHIGTLRWCNSQYNVSTPSAMDWPTGRMWMRNGRKTTLNRWLKKWRLYTLRGNVHKRSYVARALYDNSATPWQCLVAWCHRATQLSQ
mmetsp:Transcript_1568/g.4003  ORF Transcript_1568/g.4003 Transcript_1568/m.4003 type:complete len:91 (-) Transcript_1568:1262-1534(-)